MKFDLSNRGSGYTVEVEVVKVESLPDCHLFVIETKGALDTRREYFLDERQLKTLAYSLEMYCTNEFKLKGLFDE